MQDRPSFCLCVLVFENDVDYDGIDDPMPPQFTENSNQRCTNQVNEENIQNPYYEGDFDVLAQGTDRSRVTLYPDSSDVDIVTSSQNVYYEM